MMNFEAAAIHLWYQDGNRRQFKDADESTQHFYLDRAHEVVEAALGDRELYNLVESDPEYGRYRVLTENQYKPLPEGVRKWWSNGDGSPDGYLVQAYPEVEA